MASGAEKFLVSGIFCSLLLFKVLAEVENNIIFLMFVTEK